MYYMVPLVWISRTGENYDSKTQMKITFGKKEVYWLKWSIKRASELGVI